MAHVLRQHAYAAHCDSVVEMCFLYDSLEDEKAVGCEVLDHMVVEDVLSILAVSPNGSTLEGNWYAEPRKSPTRGVPLYVEGICPHSDSVQAKSTYCSQAHASRRTDHDRGVERSKLTFW